MSKLKWVVWRAEGASEAENVALERREEGGPLIVIGAVFKGRGLYKNKFLVKYKEQVFTKDHPTEAAARAWLEERYASENELTWSQTTAENGNRFAHVGTEQIGHVFFMVSTGKWIGCTEQNSSPDLNTEAEAMSWVEKEYAERLDDIEQEAERQQALDEGRSGEERLILDWRGSSDGSTWFAFFDDTVPTENGREIGIVQRVSDTKWTAETAFSKNEFTNRLDAQLYLEDRWRAEQDKPPRGDRFYREPTVADCSSGLLEDRLIEAVLGVIRTRSTQSIFDLQEEEPITWEALRALMRERIHEILEDDLDGKLAALRMDEPSVSYEQVLENAKWKCVASCAVTVEGVTLEVEEQKREPELPFHTRLFEVVVGNQRHKTRMNASDFFAGVENLRVFFDGRRG